jgi:hypothetical protein
MKIQLDLTAAELARLIDALELLLEKFKSAMSSESDPNSKTK